VFAVYPQGLLGLVSYLGAANAGIPLSWVVNKYGWDGYFAGALAKSVSNKIRSRYQVVPTLALLLHFH
jgi:sugar phosphate permease